MKRQSLLQGAFILGTVGFINRLMGFILRIFLVKIIGDEGLGIFQMVYPFYVTLLLISTAGFPLAISKLIPEKNDKERKIHALHLLKISLLFVSFTAGLTVLFTCKYANFITTSVLEDSRTYYTIIILAPALFITTIASIFRSFFQGFQNMIPTAISQLTEQISRFAATLIILSIISSLSLSYKAAGIAFGIIIGEMAGLLFLLIYFFFWYNSIRKNINNSDKSYGIIKSYKKIAFLALPITGGRILHSLIKSFEAVLIPSQLKLSGLVQAEATALFGQLSGMVEQIVFLPAVITTALTISLIPNISKNYAKNNLTIIRKNYQDVLRIITYMGIPASLFFYIYGTEICKLLFAYPQAGKILSALAIAAPFIYFLQVSSGMLNGLGKPLIAVKNITIGSTINILLIYLLVSDPAWRITGAAIASASGYILSSFLNYYAIKSKIDYKLNIVSVILKPLFSAFVVYLIHPYIFKSIYFVPFIISPNLQIIYILSISAIIYLTIMYLLGAITAKDIKRFKF